MIHSFIMEASALLVIRQPGSIISPIAKFLGIIYNALFSFIYSLITTGSLGLAIILFTILVKFILFPLMIKQQKSSFKLQQLQPEMNKIRAKYKDKKDQLSQQKMAVELQKFQKDNGINMLSGCLPLLIQLPILYALYYIFQQAYSYVDIIAVNYTDIANAILAIPEQLRLDVLKPYADSFIKENMSFLKVTGYNLDTVNNLLMLINDIRAEEWTNIIAGFGSAGGNLSELIAQKNSIELFLGIPLINRPGWALPGILVPILAALTTWGQSKIMQQLTNNTTDPNDPAAAMTNSMTKTMLYVMPLMMGFMTFNVPAALGLYWIVSNIISIIQQILLKKHFKKKFEREAQQNG